MTALAPTYTVSPLATGMPASGTTLDFTNPQTYTVTAEDRSIKIYTVAVTVVDAQPPLFTTWCETNRFAVGGTNDNFTGPEASSPSAGLLTRLQLAGVASFKGFDDCTVNDFFAHTFANLPQCGMQSITAARLTVRLKPCGAECVNDSIGLGFTDASGTLQSPYWERRLGVEGSTPGLLPDNWCNHTDGYTFSFDLAALPGGGDLLPALNQYGFLDFTCQDNTAVDYLVLEVTSCCCATNKTVERGQSWTFDTPTAWDLCCGTNVTLWLASSNLVASTPPCREVWQGVWWAVDCSTNISTCTQTVTVADTTPPALLSVTPGSLSNKVCLTFSEPLDPASANDVANYSIDSGVTVTAAVLAPPNTVCLSTTPLTPGPTYNLSIHGVGVRDLCGIPMESNTLLPFSCPTKPCLIFAGLQQCPLGDASLSLQSTQLVVRPSTNGPDRVSIALNGAQGFEAHWQDYDPPGTMPAGAYLRSQLFGTAGTVTNGLLGWMQMTKAGQSNFVAAVDFSGLGVSTCTVNAYDGTNLVAHLSNIPVGVVWTSEVSQPPWRDIHYYQSGSFTNHGWYYTLASRTDLRLAGGPTVVADSVVVTPEGAPLVSSLSGVKLLASGIPKIVITEEHVLPLGPLPVLVVTPQYRGPGCCWDFRLSVGHWSSGSLAKVVAKVLTTGVLIKSADNLDWGVITEVDQSGTTVTWKNLPNAQNDITSIVRACFAYIGSSGFAIEFAGYSSWDIVYPDNFIKTVTVGTQGECSCMAPPTNVVLWLPFDENEDPNQTAHNVIAYSGSFPHEGTHTMGIIPATPGQGPTVVSGVVGQALSFDGVDDSVVVPHYCSALNIANSQLPRMRG